MHYRKTRGGGITISQKEAVKYLINLTAYFLYSNTANDTADCGGRACKRTSDAPVFWAGLHVGSASTSGWGCFGIKETDVELTPTTGYGESTKRIFETTDGKKVYASTMSYGWTDVRAVSVYTSKTSKSLSLVGLNGNPGQEFIDAIYLALK